MRNPNPTRNRSWGWFLRGSLGIFILLAVSFLYQTKAQAGFCGDNCFDIEDVTVDKNSCEGEGGVTKIVYTIVSQPDCHTLDKIMISNEGFCGEVEAVDENGMPVPHCNLFGKDLHDHHDGDKDGTHDGDDEEDICWKCFVDFQFEPVFKIVKVEQTGGTTVDYTIELPGCCWTTAQGLVQLQRGLCVERFTAPAPVVDTTPDCSDTGNGGVQPIDILSLSGGACALNKNSKEPLWTAWGILVFAVASLGFTRLAAKKIRKK